MPKITQIERPDLAGIWVESDGGSIGLVAEKGKKPFLCINSPNGAFPTLAIGVDTDGEAMVQIAGPDGKACGARQVSFHDLIKHLTQKPE